MKIACIGCSWTEGALLLDTKITKKIKANSYTQTQQSTYPYILKQFLSKKNCEATVYNAGRSGGSVHFYPFMANYVLEQFDPDVFVIQITTSDRNFMKLDPLLKEHSQMQFGYDKEEEGYYKIWDNNINLIHLSPGMGWCAPLTASRDRHKGLKDNQVFWKTFVHDKKQLKETFNDIVERMWKDRIKGRVAPDISLSEFSDYVSIWWEQEAKNQNYVMYQYLTTIYSLIDQLEAKGKKVIPFFWQHQDDVYNFKSQLVPLRQYPSIEKLFGNKLFKSFSIDKGNHFGVEGNTRLVQEFLGPQVLETMK